MYDRSDNIVIREDAQFTFRRMPVFQSTDCIRGRVGFRNGLHIWEIIWPTQTRGRLSVIGVVTAEASLHWPGYASLIGVNKNMWGWDLMYI